VFEVEVIGIALPYHVKGGNRVKMLSRLWW